MNKIVGIAIIVILSVAIVLLVIDNKKLNESSAKYQKDISVLNAKNDSIKKLQDSLLYQISDIHIQYNNVSQITGLLLSQDKNAKNEIDSLKNLRNYVTKIDSSVYLLNCKQLSDSLSIPSF